MDCISFYLRKLAKVATERTITFLGTGPSNPILDRRGKSRRLNTSSLITYKGLNYLIDIPPTFDESIHFDYLFLTHLHNDAFGGFDKIRGRDFTIAIPKPIRLPITEQKRVYLDIGYQNKVGDLRVIPFRVDHDVIYGFPTFGYQFIFPRAKITYASDMVGIPKESEKYFNDIDILIADGAGWRNNLVTHFGIMPFLRLVEEKGWKIGKIYFTQIGRPVPDHEKAQKEIQKVNPNAFLAYDGLKVLF